MTSAYRDWFLDQLAMYAAYHTDKRNQITHYIGVPLIIFSVVIALDQVRVGDSITVAIIVVGLLLLAYLIAIPFVGMFALVLSAPLYLAAVVLGGLTPAALWTVTAASFVGGWAIQLLGHVFERRRPAFTVNMLQVLMAPAFLVAELIFTFGLQGRLAKILEMRARKFARP